jgi:peptidoglycan/LPS O-acetylase OafA/YrhL
MTHAKNTIILLLDFLRVIAIVMIIFSHVLFTIGQPWLGLYQPAFGMYPFLWKSWGEIGVTLFLIISGLSLEFTHGRDRMRIGQFYLNRLLRIYPIYYMSLLIGLLVELSFAYWATLRRGISFNPLPDFGYVDLILAVTGGNAFFGKWGGPLLWSSWFIGVIMILYILYPAISWSCRKSPWTCIFGLFFISTISRLLTGDSQVLLRNPMAWFPLNRVFEFGLGVFMANVIYPDVLRSPNRALERIPLLPYLAAVSFPLFLIHDPFRRLIVMGPQTNVSRTIGILVFLAISLAISSIILVIDRRIKISIRGSFPLRE